VPVAIAATPPAAGTPLTMIGSGLDRGAFTAVVGNATYSVDLAFYRPQIIAIVPEPAGGLVVTIAAAALACRSARSARAIRRRIGPFF
jgi:hypothetical protein